MESCATMTTAPPPARALRACPRCDSERVVSIGVERDSVFAWHECAECRHLWAVPSGWTPHGEFTVATEAY